MEGKAEGLTFEVLPEYVDLFQEIPENKVIALLGGRGSAKSTHLALFLNDLTYQSGHVILFTRYTMTAAERSIIPEFESMMEKAGNRADFHISGSEIVNKISGSKIIFSGIKTSSGNQTANLKSIPGLTTFVIDEGEEFLDEDSYNAIQLSIRSVLRPNRVIWVQNPSHKNHFFYKRYVAPDAQYPCTIIKTSYLDNLHNLSAEFVEEAEIMKQTNYKRYCHVFLGEWLDDAEGLLWDMDIIDKFRVTEVPQLIRCFVAIDPAVTANEKSDETGVVVVGVDANGHGYVLEDKSGVYTPNQWANVAVELYNKHNCNEVVAEVNQGGDMVDAVLKGVDNTLRVVLVRATKGKYVRAEPVYSLYQLGRIHHVGYHSKLEAQMVSFNPDQQTGSPDRMDALVWGVTHALVKNIQGNSGGYGGRKKHAGGRYT